ncbi:hypothetical protein MKX03_016318 [Papaver bracteatum]|nr:hypothetical protein MKX03_016318 [Papaver bracteatum]
MEESGTLTLKDQPVNICRKLQEHLPVEGLELHERKDDDLIRRNFPASVKVWRSFVKKSIYHGSPRVTHDILARVREISALLPKDLSDVECLGINNTRRKLIRRKEPDVNNLIRRKKAKKGFQTVDDNNFTNRSPPTRYFGFLKKYVPSHSCFSDVLIVCLSKNSTLVGFVNKLKQVKPSAGYLHSITNSGARLNWTANYEASSTVHKIHYEREEAFTNSHGVLIQYYEIPRKPHWFVFLLYGSPRRRNLKGDTTAHSTPFPATTITTKIFSLKEEDTSMLLTANAHSGNIYFQMERFKGGGDGMYFINPGKTLEKFTMTARAIVSIEHPHDVIVQSGGPYGLGTVMRFDSYISAHLLSGRHAQDMFANQMQKSFTEPRVTDSSIDYLPIKVAALKSHLIRETETVQLPWRLPFSMHSLMTYYLPVVLQQPKTVHTQSASEVGVTIVNDVMESQLTLNLIGYSALSPILGVLCVLFLLNANLKTQDLVARCFPFDLGGTSTTRLNYDVLFCIKKSFKILVAMSTVTERFMGVPIKSEASELLIENGIRKNFFDCV